MKRVKVISSSHKASSFFKVKCTSIQITVDPRHPTAMPECCFLCLCSRDSLQVLAPPYRSPWTPDTRQPCQSVFTFMWLFAGPGTSIQITVDPRHPTAMPECVHIHVTLCRSWHLHTDHHGPQTPDSHARVCSHSCDSLQVLAPPHRSPWTPDTRQPCQSVFTFMWLFAGPGTSIQITVDPRHPTAMPEFRFLGADQGLLIHCSYCVAV